MTLQNLPGGLVVPPYPFGIGFAGTSNLLIDATGEKAAFVIEIPKTGTITSVGFLTNTVLTSQTLRASLQTLSGGNPTGTFYGGSTQGTQAAPASNTYNEVTLGTPASVTRGDRVGLVVEWDSTVGSANIAYTGSSGGLAGNFPNSNLFTTSWASNSGFPICSLGYSGTFYPVRGCWPWSVPPTQLTFNSGSSPNEYALAFQLPFPCTASGFWGLINPANVTTDDITINLYQGTTLLSSLSLPAVTFQSTAGHNLGQGDFPAAINLVANTQYYLSVLPATTGNIHVDVFNTLDAAHMGAFPGGTAFTLATRAGGAWTAVPAQRPMLGLYLDSFQDGTGGGGGGYSRSRVVGGI